MVWTSTVLSRSWVPMAGVRGRQRLGWVDSVKPAFDIRMMTVDAARQCAKDRKEFRTLVHTNMI